MHMPLMVHFIFYLTYMGCEMTLPHVPAEPSPGGDGPPISDRNSERMTRGLAFVLLNNGCLSRFYLFFPLFFFNYFSSPVTLFPLFRWKFVN